MNKKEKSVKTVTLPGERGPEIQYRLTGFNQLSKKKAFSKPKKIPNTQVISKNTTTNVVHVGTEKPDHSDDTPKAETTLVPLKEKDEIKITNIDEYKGTLLTEFTCASDKDLTGSWISGAEFVQDGHIVLLDTNNSKLKRFNTLYRLLSEIEVPIDCANITRISDKEIAVTCLNEIHFYSIGHFGMSRSSKHFDVNGDVFGISYEDNRYAVICDIESEEKSAIRILDIFGDEISVIKPKNGKDEIIDISIYCQIDTHNQCVAVSDFDNRHVVCYHFNGSLKWICEVEGGPRGLLKIGKDILVSDNYGQEICAISLQSGKKKTLLGDQEGVFNPEWIACNHRDFRLAITQRAFDTISVFNLIKKI